MTSPKDPARHGDAEWLGLDNHQVGQRTVFLWQMQDAGAHIPRLPILQMKG